MTVEAMRDDDPMRLSGAVWCEDHDRWECSRVSRRSQTRCHGNAIRGRSSCRMHAGRPAAVEKALGEAALAAWSTEAADADAAPLDLGRVVMDQLRVAVMRADLYGEMVRWQLETEDEGGLVGKTFAAGRDGARVESGEQVRALVRLEAEWRDRAVRFAKTAHDMGIDQRHVELEQAKAEQVVGAVRLGLAALPGLLPADRDAFLRAFLGALGRGDGDVVAGEVTA